MKYLFPVALVITAVGVAVAYAQTAPQRQTITPSSGNYYGGGGYPSYSRSSTAAEGRLRGMGDLVRATGQANLDNSAAAINYTTARSQQIENRDQWTNTYFSMRETNRRARAAERRPAPSMEDLVRYAQVGKPKRLSPGELNPVTGKIAWPVLLQADKFTNNRASLDTIFTTRATSSAVSPENYTKARHSVYVMLADLKKDIRQLPPDQYMVAQKFLKSLNYEIIQPVG